MTEVEKLAKVLRELILAFCFGVALMTLAVGAMLFFAAVAP